MREKITLLLTCFAILFFGCDKDNVMDPIEVETLDFKQQYCESITLNGKIINFGKGIDSYGHCWSKHSTPTINDDKTVVNNQIKGNYQSTVTGLDDGEKYYFRSYALNNDEIVYGEVKEFITNEYDLPSLNLKVNLVESFSAKVAISLTYMGGYDNIDKIGICLSIEDSTDIMDSVLTINNIADIGMFELDLTNLSMGQKYFVKAFAINKKGISYSEEYEFTTLQPYYIEGDYSVVTTRNDGVNASWNEKITKIGVDTYLTEYVGTFTYPLNPDYGFHFIEKNKIITVPTQKLADKYSNDVWSHKDGNIDAQTGIITIYYTIYFEAGNKTFTAVFTPKK
jgi:hypothetical protein